MSIEEGTGITYWISGPKKRGGDKAKATPVSSLIDIRVIARIASSIASTEAPLPIFFCHSSLLLRLRAAAVLRSWARLDRCTPKKAQSRSISSATVEQFLGYPMYRRAR